MKYFKNAELVKLYNVSDKAVRNWIEGTQQGRFKLDLIEVNSKIYIAYSLRNRPKLEAMAEKGRKFKNKRNLREVSPTDQFYELFNLSQQIDILQNLDKYREIPQHYRYFGEGGSYWDAYLQKLSRSGWNNMLTAGIHLLQADYTYLETLLAQYKKVQVADIGVGNGLAAKGLLEVFEKSGKLSAYIGIDCSQKLLDITEKNINEWFAGRVPVIKVLKDVTHERFPDELLNNSFNNNPAETATILLFQGGTIGNFRSPTGVLQTIRESMGRNDFLVTTDKLDSENARKFFDFNIDADVAMLSQRNRMLLQLLSIDDSLYDVEQFFDKHHYARHIQVRLKFDITISFKIAQFKKSVHLKKGESILVFRMWEWDEQELISLYEQCGFSQLQMTKTRDEEYALLVSVVKVGPTSHPTKTNHS